MLLQRLRACALPIGNRGVCSFAGGHDHERVVGGRVTVNADAVERGFCQFMRKCMHQFRVNGCIGGHEAQHGRHVGADHARTFGDTGDGDGFAVHLKLTTDGLGQSVCGHDGLRSQRPVVAQTCRKRLGQTVHNALHRQGLHDHARRKRQYLLRFDT